MTDPSRMPASQHQALVAAARADQLTQWNATPDREPDCTMTVELYDIGAEPEWHKDRSLYGPWYRWRARFVDGLNPPFVADCGQTPAEAIRRAASRFTDRTSS